MIFKPQGFPRRTDIEEPQEGLDNGCYRIDPGNGDCSLRNHGA